MPLKLTDEQQSYTDDPTKLRQLSLWVLGSRCGLAVKRRKWSGIARDMEGPDKTKPITNPSENTIKRMMFHLKAEVEDPILVRLVNGYHQNL